jgi:hypothetical protein
MQRIAFVLVGVGVAALIGCAAGSEPELESSELMTVPIEAGPGDEEETITLAPPSTEPTDQDAGTATPPKDAGADAAQDAGPPAGSSCSATNTCAAATDLGTVSGDQGSDSQFVQGATSAWFTVRVTENDNGVFGSKLKLNATLQSPAGANFDVFVYVPSSDTRECSTVSASSTTSGFDSASASFGEGGTVSNGSSDSRTVTVEVRHVSGACSPTAKWTLNLYGNQ